MKQRKEWVAPGDTPKPRVKPDLHPRKTMICVWWDWEGMVHWDRVNEAIRLKRSHRQGQTILLHNNSRPHVAEVVMLHESALQELEWEVLQIRRILRTLHPRITIFSALCRTT